MIATSFTSWQTHTPAPDPRYAQCSPNLGALRVALAYRFGLKDLGCYAVRNVIGGTVPSSHEFGAAWDARYLEQIGRERCVRELIPWLIDHSGELHLQAIHDYIGTRIWRAGRTASIDDAHTLWWKAQSPDGTGMGQPSAGWLHLETTPEGWLDTTSINARIIVAPPPTPEQPPPAPPPTPTPAPVPGPPTSEEDDMTIGIFTSPDFGAVFIGPSTADGRATMLEWSGPGTDERVAHRLDQQLAAGAKPFPISLSALTDAVTLIGPVPYGDAALDWTRDHFFRVVP